MNIAAAKSPGAVIYTRVSTGEQDKHGTSPESQLENCRKKALGLSLLIVAEYYDPGISGGFLLARREFQAAIADIKAGRADTLICPNISRYSRDVEHQQAVKKAVKAAGGRLVFCDAEFEDTAAGDLNFTIQGGFAEYERKVIRERCISGHHRRAKAGIQTARVIAPYGYAIPTKADILRGIYPVELLGKYLIVEEQAAVVRQLFTRYVSGGESLVSLSRWLNQSGLPTSGRAAQWRSSVLQYLLQNPVYKGQAVYGRFDHFTDESRLTQSDPQTGLPYLTLKAQRQADPSTWITWEVPAIVTKATWEAAGMRLTENRRLMSGNPHQVRMLTGRIRCPNCGAGMVCVSPGKRQVADGSIRVPPPRYVCNRYRTSKKHTGQTDCFPDGYNVPDTEQAVIMALLDACRRPESIREAIAAYIRSQEAPKPRTNARGQLMAVDKALHLLEERQAATVQAQIAGIMAGANPNAYNAVFADMAMERKDLEDRRGVLSRQLQGQVAGQRRQHEGQASILLLSDILDQAHQVLLSADVAGGVKRDIVGTVIEKVICRKGEERKGRGKKSGAEVVFLPSIFGEELSSEEVYGMSSLQPSGEVRDADGDRDL